MPLLIGLRHSPSPPAITPGKPWSLTAKVSGMLHEFCWMLCLLLQIVQVKSAGSKESAMFRWMLSLSLLRDAMKQCSMPGSVLKDTMCGCCAIVVVPLSMSCIALVLFV